MRITTLLFALLAAACVGSESPAALECRCPELKEWIAALPLLPNGQGFSPEELVVSERPYGLVVVGSRRQSEPTHIADLIRTLQLSDMTVDVTTDTENHWESIVYPPGAASNATSADPWRMRIIDSDGFGVHIDVAIDGSPQGIQTEEGLEELYRGPDEALAEAQNQRQDAAIQALETLEAALRTG